MYIMKRYNYAFVTITYICNFLVIIVLVDVLRESKVADFDDVVFI